MPNVTRTYSGDGRAVSSASGWNEVARTLTRDGPAALANARKATRAIMRLTRIK